MRGRLTTAPAVIDPATTMGTVCLTASDLDRSQTFYEQTLGLRASRPDDATVVLSAPGGPALVELHGDPSARPLERRATGLFHMAVLVPSRVELARSLWRLAVRRWPLDGASDHLVSEALYLSDPDGNGIEIYRDRPRTEWPRDGDQLRMSTLALDLDSLLGELRDATGLQASAPRGTRIGHVHLQVSDLAQAEAFYHGVLGFDVTVRGYPGALFVSAGGYHHHIGLNTWHSAGAAPSPAGAVGLRSFTIALPDQRELENVLARIEAAGIPVRPGPSGVLVRDPFANGVVLATHGGR
ncbi:MAG: VOC family protein [Solirubrobacterales bacterium]|nr:VOC family protein [Solirubrobacterales bacterium]